MKKLILFHPTMICYALIMVTALLSCRKSMPIATLSEQDKFLSVARSWFLENLATKSPDYHADNPRNARTLQKKQIGWQSAGMVLFRGRPALLAPVIPSKEIFIRADWAGNNIVRLGNEQKLLLYQDTTRLWHAELLTFLPDTNFLGSHNQQFFSGIILVDDWCGNPIRKILYTRDRQAAYLLDAHASLDTTRSKNLPEAVMPATIIRSCTYIYGYNYAPGTGDDRTYWVESVGCTTMNIPDNLEGGGNGYGGLGGAGGGGGLSGGLATSPVIFRPRLIISNLQMYLKCFQLVPGATYQVTLCVDQPEPGKRTPWVFTNDGSSGSIDPFDVGHTFVILTENMPGGWSITRNIGFYPSTDVTPFSNAVPAVLNDDGSHTYNIGANYTLSSTLFFALLNTIPNAAARNYQANTYNCTNFALDVLAGGHIYLPHTIGRWAGGVGVDPGDLGEDIRTHDFVGMTRITNPGIHPSVGECD